MHKAAALEQRTLFLPQKARRADEQRIVGELLQIVGLDIDVPLEALILKLFGEHGLVPLHRVGVAFDHRHIVPIILQFRGLDKALAVDDEMGLDVHRQIVIKVLALEGVRLCAVVDRQTPEIEILIFPHGVKHFLERAHRTHQGRVRHDDLVKFSELRPAVRIQRRFVGPDVEALVLAHDDVVGKLFKGRAALCAELAVADDDQLGQVLIQVSEVVGDEIIHIAVFFVKEKDAQSFHCVFLLCSFMLFCRYPWTESY